MMAIVRNRRSLTPATGVPAADVTGSHAMRRGGPRHEMSERVVLLGENFKQREGWALNVSRGGVRVIVEEPVSLGEEYQVTIGDDASRQLNRRARVVWVQEERDGFVVGLEFLFSSGEHASMAPPPDDKTGDKTDPPKG